MLRGKISQEMLLRPRAGCKEKCVGRGRVGEAPERSLLGLQRGPPFLSPSEQQETVAAWVPSPRAHPCLAPVRACELHSVLAKGTRGAAGQGRVWDKLPARLR